jgi:hypothetical protein
MTATLFLALTVTAAQASRVQAEEVVARYDIAPLLKLYPQTTAKAALESAVKAAEKGRYDYLAAHLMEPGFVDAESVSRGNAFAADVEADLRLRRQREKEYGSDLPRDKRIPHELEPFAKLVASESQVRGFQRFVADIREKSNDDPGQLKDLRRFARDGTIEESGDTAKVSLRDIKDRAVYLKKIGQRWYVENRQIEEKPAAGANP